ncbi:MAG: hypothetical protein KH452_11815 [Clostridiales bacterium]|nr:hypothetical protein [Clostridiales bacterium]
MGKRENPLLWYYNKEENFAGLVNGWLFQGREVISAKNVLAGERRFLRRTSRRTTDYKERYRDIYKQVNMTGVRLFIGTELQSGIHYLMPLRVMDYEVLSYLEQARNIQREHGSKKDLKGNEFLTDLWRWIGFHLSCASIFRIIEYMF